VKHGSCGVGVGVTIARHENTTKVFFVDLFNPSVLREKMRAVKDYYEIFSLEIDPEDIEKYYMTVQRLLIEKRAVLVNEKAFFLQPNIKKMPKVFEGSQGILLDQDHGFFPNVTRSYTTSRNAIEICQRNGIPVESVNYVSRCYLTRHGYGWMPNEGYEVENSGELNVTGEWQGAFRIGQLDIDLLNYALECDNCYSSISSGHPSLPVTKRMFFTCLDQVESWNAIMNGTEERVDSTDKISKLLNIKNILFSRSPEGKFSEEMLVGIPNALV
jgi:adenylosuccinate synthase